METEMNRIILIGNGFDLAHGLPTRYEDFINWYWERRLIGFARNYGKVDASDILCIFKITTPESVITWNDVLNQWKYRYHAQNGAQFMKEAIIGDTEKFEIDYSTFFGNICKIIETKGWVDVENEYYHMLCSCINKGKNNVENLNIEFQVLKSLLIEYLQTFKEDKNIIEEVKNKMLAPLKAREIAIESKQIWTNSIAKRIDDYEKGDSFYQIRQFSELSKKANKKINDFLDKNLTKIEDDGWCYTIEDEVPDELLYPNRVMLLNFNYTSIADAYLPKDFGFIVNHIHGKLNESNDLIFGYGDELDKDYKDILNLNDNEYLRNIKSVKYLESSNYRDMLSFIESAPYQVYIMGHSCGNSDRTLLNTLFEHRNCITIKPFYHQKDDGTDNYLDLVQNISRNFTDMKLMRDRVVNKTFCSPLPQKGNG